MLFKVEDRIWHKAGLASRGGPDGYHKLDGGMPVIGCKGARHQLYFVSMDEILDQQFKRMLKPRSERPTVFLSDGRSPSSKAKAAGNTTSGGVVRYSFRTTSDARSTAGGPGVVPTSGGVLGGRHGTHDRRSTTVPRGFSRVIRPPDRPVPAIPPGQWFHDEAVAKQTGTRRDGCEQSGLGFMPEHRRSTVVLRRG
jgi:hypothetical protein